MQVAKDPCTLLTMNAHQRNTGTYPKRRPSKLGQQLADDKIERAKRQTPEERLAIALHLSDVCYKLTQCSPKP